MAAYLFFVKKLYKRAKNCYNIDYTLVQTGFHGGRSARFSSAASIA